MSEDLNVILILVLGVARGGQSRHFWEWPVWRHFLGGPVKKHPVNNMEDNDVLRKEYINKVQEIVYLYPIDPHELISLNHSQKSSNTTSFF